MVLVAAIAVGLWLVRTAVTRGYSYNLPPNSPTSIVVEVWLLRYLTFATPTLMAASLAHLGFALAPPRPTRRTLARRPGFVASIASLVGLLVVFLLFGLQLYAQPARRIYFPTEIYRYMAPSFVGYFVIGSLVPSFIARRLRPTRDWVDRLGYTIGIGWLASLLIHWTKTFVNVFS